MAPTSCPDDVISALDRTTLLATARASIGHGVAHGCPLELDPTKHTLKLQQHSGCFVTLYLDDMLRGCVGSLRAREPVVAEVARSAFSAAFKDTRFPSVSANELERLHIHVSVLSKPQPMKFANERELMAQLQPGIDGLILSEGTRLGTFLPQVWDKFPDPSEFMRHLRLKAGLEADHWSDTLRVERYTTQCFS